MGCNCCLEQQRISDFRSPLGLNRKTLSTRPPPLSRFGAVYLLSTTCYTRVSTIRLPIMANNKPPSTFKSQCHSSTFSKTEKLSAVSADSTSRCSFAVYFPSNFTQKERRHRNGFDVNSLVSIKITLICITHTQHVRFQWNWI